MECEDDQKLIILPDYLCLVYLLRCHPELRWLSYPTLQDVSWVPIVAVIGEECIYFVNRLWQVIHLLKVLFHEGSKLCSTDTTQYHFLGISMRDNPMDHVHAWKCEVPASNPVQARLLYVDIDSIVLQILLKSAWKYVIDVLPFDLDLLVYEQFSIFIDGQAHRQLLDHISSCALSGVLWHYSLGSHCTCTAERLMNNYDTWR